MLVEIDIYVFFRADTDIWAIHGPTVDTENSQKF